MINHEDNPEYLNSFLDYTMTILNKSPNTVKEYNYDLATFLKFIKMHFGLTTEEDFSKIEIKDVDLNTIKKIKLDDIHAFLSYLTTTYHSKAATRARKVSSIRVFFNYLCGIIATALVYIILSYSYLISDKIEHYNMLELEIELEKQSQETLKQIKKMLEDNEIIVTELDMSKYKNNIIKIIGKNKKKSEHSFVTDLISFDNVIKVEQN